MKRGETARKSFLVLYITVMSPISVPVTDATPSQMPKLWPAVTKSCMFLTSCAYRPMTNRNKWIGRDNCPIDCCKVRLLKSLLDIRHGSLASLVEAFTQRHYRKATATRLGRDIQICTPIL